MAAEGPPEGMDDEEYRLRKGMGLLPDINAGGDFVSQQKAAKKGKKRKRNKKLAVASVEADDDAGQMRDDPKIDTDMVVEQMRQ